MPIRRFSALPIRLYSICVLAWQKQIGITSRTLYLFQSEACMTETTQEQKISPMMAQWHACKKEASSAVLFFRMGDFYEAFYDDAVLLSKELDLTLTRR